MNCQLTCYPGEVPPVLLASAQSVIASTVGRSCQPQRAPQCTYCMDMGGGLSRSGAPGGCGGADSPVVMSRNLFSALLTQIDHSATIPPI
jgi:hypothetical protein